MKPVLDAAAVATHLTTLADQIAQNLGKNEPIFLVGIRRRGVPIAERIAASLKKSHGLTAEVGILDIAFYRDDLSHVAEQPVVGVTDIPFSIEEQTVYLVDDVLYTGRTVRAALSALLEFGRPQAVRLVTLVDRGYRELPIQADFVGLELKTQPTDNVKVCLSEIDDQDAVSIEEHSS